MGRCLQIPDRATDNIFVTQITFKLPGSREQRQAGRGQFYELVAERQV
jgi:hypothetical protein